MTSEVVPALKVHQWLPEWDDLTFDEGQRQSKPEPHFYLFALPASKLRALSGIYRRSAENAEPRQDDLGIQRRHDPERSGEIKRYVEGGYPWSSLSDAKRVKEDSQALKKPGWLPTAVVINILGPGDVRDGRTAQDDDVIKIEQSDENPYASILLPSAEVDSLEVLPIEIIDGQHRLFAFDEADANAADYYLPVVAFHRLDISWQAYLFWTINIKPKKINPSLAYDLYPLLREQDWLESGEVVHVYRESRAQELTEMLWSTPSSPWYQRINMLGGTRKVYGPVTQAAFIRSLVASMVKPWPPRGGSPGGIFGGTTDGADGLQWSRAQQSAYLVTAWQLVAEGVKSSQSEWALALREEAAELDIDMPESSLDPAFAGANSLLASDQGVRAVQYVVNDLAYVRNVDLQLAKWRDSAERNELTPDVVEEVAASLRNQPVFDLLKRVGTELATFDWRTSNSPSLTEQQRRGAAAFRGSGGYKELRARVIEHLQASHDPVVSSAASMVTM